jgi:hypothetical protein
MTTDIRDFSLVQGAYGSVIAHDPMCPVARRHAADGEPVATFLDGQRSLTDIGDGILLHRCLTEKD